MQRKINVNVGRCPFCGSLVKAGKSGGGARDYLDRIKTVNEEYMGNEAFREDTACPEEEAYPREDAACREGEVCQEGEVYQGEEVCQEGEAYEGEEVCKEGAVCKKDETCPEGEECREDKECPQEVCQGEEVCREDAVYPEDAACREERLHNVPLSNNFKVFLTVVSSIIPGFGQLLGIIAAIAFMNSEDDPDRRSFGTALLSSSLIMFVFVSLLYFVFILIISKAGY